MKNKIKLKIAIVHITVALSLATAVALFILAFNERSVSQKNNLDIATQNLERISEVVKANVELSFLSVDQTLRRAAERQYFNLLFGQTLKDDMRHSLAVWVNETPHVDTIFFTDEKGIITILFNKNKSFGYLKQGDEILSLRHFAKHKDSEESDVMMSVYEKDGKQHILMSRRVDSIDGNFGGLVVAVINEEYLTNFINSIDNSNNIKMLINVNGDKLTNKSMPDELKYINSMLHRPDNEPEQTIVKVINGQQKIFSFQAITGYPVELTIIENIDVSAKWLSQMRNYTVVLLMFFIFIATVLALITRLDKQMEKVKDSEKTALLASQAKSEFLAKMSHELHTPLNTIIGYSDMINAGYFGKVTSAQHERLSDINMCGQHLLDMIKDILEFTKGEANKLSLNEEKFDVYGAIVRSMRITEHKAKKKNVEVINKSSRELPDIFADKCKIQQILINLITNAVKFTESGGIVTVDSYVAKNGNFIISVKDNGIGMKKEDIPTALSVFGQINATAKNEGTGLGLPLCKIMTELHEGKLRIESKFGYGTKISVVLPKSRIIQQEKELFLQMAA